MATTTATRAPKQARPLPAVHGSCRWLAAPSPKFPAGWLTLNGRGYAVELLQGGAGQVIGVRLRKPDGTLYDVNLEGHPECSCPDGTFNAPRRADGVCKHGKAVVAALKALNLL